MAVRNPVGWPSAIPFVFQYVPANHSLGGLPNGRFVHMADLRIAFGAYEDVLNSGRKLYNIHILQKGSFRHIKGVSCDLPKAVF